jgi:hypothetical protein
MNHEIDKTFDSIESAHEFVALLAEAVTEAKRDIDADVQRESGSKFPRRLEALRLALYNVEKLELYMNKSRRILNDLRTLRRLLFEERTAAVPPVQPEPPAVEPVEIVLPPVPSPPAPPMDRSTAQSPRAVAA